MQVIRIGAVAPPDTNRSEWSRELLRRAIEEEIEPRAVAAHHIKSFTVAVSPVIADKIKTMARERQSSIASIAAGLIEAIQAAPDNRKVHEAKADVANVIGKARVRDILHPLLDSTLAGFEQGKVVFAEAATGSGKGAMIASLAAQSASKGNKVVISAPLAVTWQLMSDFKAIEGPLPTVSIRLGRPNFIDPEALTYWAQENDRPKVLEWLGDGAPTLSSRTRGVETLIGHSLNYLLEDALALAEDIPVTEVVLDAGGPEDCPAEQQYQSLKDTQHEASIILCSHHLLAAHIRIQRSFSDSTGQESLLDAEENTTRATSLPEKIGTLIIDEAQLLEAAFASVYSQSLHVNAFSRFVEKHLKYRKKPVLAALENVESVVNKYAGKGAGKASKACRLDDVPGLAEELRHLIDTLDAITTRSMDGFERRAINNAKYATKAMLSGKTTLRLELSPVRKQASILSGASNLEKPLGELWDSVGHAALVSATLYCESDTGNLMRWKLAVPKSRALYARPVHPAWTREPVLLQTTRTLSEPDDGDEWLQQTARIVGDIARTSRGGTLVLCTSFQNVEGLRDSLGDELGPRLITQSKKMSASMCATQFKALHQAGLRPVWLGLGAAWTGINLSDESAAPEKDTLLSDLVITRLPMGANRSLTHERRVAMIGFGAAVQEAIWLFRQGLGRLVRREGVSKRNLWVLDPRLDRKENWTHGFRKVLSRYSTAE